MPGSFIQGMQLGQDAVSRGFQMSRQREADAREQWKFEQEQQAAARAQGLRADLANVADGGLTGVTPNMTRAGPDGMGPVLSPSDVDVRYRDGATPAVGGLSVPASTEGSTGAQAPALPGALSPDGRTGQVGAPGRAVGMSPADKDEAIAGLQLKQGDVKGYRESRTSAREQKKLAAKDEFAQKLINMDNETLMQNVKKWVSDNGNAPAKVGYDPKTRMFTVVHDSGAVQNIDPVQARAYMVAAFDLGNGDVEKGVASMMDLKRGDHKEKREDVKMENDTATSVAQLNQGVAHVDIARARLGLAGAAEARAAKNEKRGNMVTMRDTKTGEPVVGWLNSEGTFKKADLPPGLSLPRDQTDLTPKEIATHATALVKDGIINPDTKKVYTIPEAWQAVKEASSGEGGGAEVDMDKFKAALEAARKGKGGPGGTPQVAAPQRIPDPPPQLGYNGNARAQNPLYDRWAQMYGDAYAQQQQADVQASAANRASAQGAVDQRRGLSMPPRLGY